MWTKELKAEHRKLLGRLTDGNCRRSPSDVASDYREWANRQRLGVVHVFPLGKTDRSPSNVVRAQLVAQSQVEVDPDDYVNWRAS